MRLIWREPSSSGYRLCVTQDLIKQKKVFQARSIRNYAFLVKSHESRREPCSISQKTSYSKFDEQCPRVYLDSLPIKPTTISVNYSCICLIYISSFVALQKDLDSQSWRDCLSRHSDGKKIRHSNCGRL